MINSDILAQEIVEPKKITSSTFHPINYIEAEQLSKASESDVEGLVQASFATLCEAIAGASQQRFLWATVKAYYCVFLSLRARLLIGNQVVFYLGRSPYSIQTIPGSEAKRRKGNTHEVVFKVFGEIAPSNSLFSQEIAGKKPLDWLIEKRNYCNYRAAPIEDPIVPERFTVFERSPRSALQQFFVDSSLAFDEDSAILAMPIQLLIELSQLVSLRLGCGNIPVSRHFSDILAARKLFIPEIRNEITCIEFT